jgi:molecular chaperone GrpE
MAPAMANPSPIEAPAGNPLEQARPRLAEDRLAEVMAAYRTLKNENEDFRERQSRNMERRFEQRREKLLLKFIDVLDNLDRALEAAQTSYAGQPLLEGMILVRTQLLQTLQDEGLDRIPVLGLPFDPAVAESVSTAPVNEAEQHHVVVKELLRGYRLNGRVARPSRVVIGHFEAAPSAEVAAPPAAPSEATAPAAPAAPAPSDAPRATRGRGRARGRVHDSPEPAEGALIPAPQGPLKIGTRRVVRFTALAVAVAVILTNAYYLRFLEPGISRGILGAALFGLGVVVAALASWDRPRTPDEWRALARRGAEPALLVVILGLAFGLRLWGITASLPQSYVADEYDFVHAGLRMIKGGDLNPHWWFHPSLQRYMAVATYAVVFILGVPRGRWVHVSDITVEDMLYWGRFVGVMSGTLTVLVAYLLGRKVFGSRVGLLSAALLAVFPATVQHSQYNKPDPVIALMTAASVYVTLLYLERGGQGYALASGIAVGLAASAKYNGILGRGAVRARRALPPRRAGAGPPRSVRGRRGDVPRLPHGLSVLPDRDPSLPGPDRLRHLHLRLRGAGGRGRRGQLVGPRDVHLPLRRRLRRERGPRWAGSPSPSGGSTPRASCS